LYRHWAFSEKQILRTLSVDRKKDGMMVRKDIYQPFSRETRREGCRLQKSVMFFVSVLMLFSGISVYGQQMDTTKSVPNGTDGLTLEKRKTDSLIKKLPPNEFAGQYSTFRIGLGYIYDLSTYVKDDVFNKQMDTAKLDVSPNGKTRDFRILGSGVLATKRNLSWKFAYMYDGNEKVWMLRETGLTIGLPELKSSLFIGRTKEGYSMIKVMNGHSPWGFERMMAIDVIPILADGVKLFGYAPKSRIFWNLGYYNDIFSKGQGFSTFEWQYVARVGCAVINKPEKGKTLHIGLNLRYAKPLDGKITLKSRPESNPTPFLINTGSFAANNSSHVGAEIYYSAGRIVLGSEVAAHNFYKSEASNHTFIGGNVMFAYSITGGKRPYKSTGSIFGFMPVKKSVFEGGVGEIEFVLIASTLNLNNGSIAGGQMTRITPMINWYVTKYMRLEFIYGYGMLDRYKMHGTIQFFESRIQFTVM
jgi:phosphate-selective porin OprO/OprP